MHFQSSHSGYSVPVKLNCRFCIEDSRVNKVLLLDGRRTGLLYYNYIIHEPKVKPPTYIITPTVVL